MDFIKEFFQKPVVRLVCLLMFIIGIVGLVIGGITQETLSGVLVAVVAGIAAIGGIISLVIAVINSK